MQSPWLLIGFALSKSRLQCFILWAINVLIIAILTPATTDRGPEYPVGIFLLLGGFAAVIINFLVGNRHRGDG